MNENWKFSDIPYTSLDVEALQTRYDALTRRARAAACPEDLLDVVRQRDALQQEVALCQSIATIRAFHDVTDEFYQRELQETLPRLETLDTQSLSMAIAESPYAAAVDGTFGPQLRRLLMLDQRLHTGGKELQARISRLTAQYQQLTASARYQVQGETLSGGQLRFALASTDRERRRAAYEAQQQTALENAGQLADILRQLVHARIDLARANGFDSFADYGDLAQQRLGYGRAELDAFCRQVQTHITPLYLRLQEEQRRRLGVDTLMPYDRALVFPEGNAVPVAAEELPRAAHRMYHALSPEAGEFFDEMVRHDLLDVTGSPNKISGMGFCDMLGAPYRMPFIFANFNGTQHDVEVVTHEAGHAFADWSNRKRIPSSYIWPTLEGCEVHSMSMEFFAWPWAEGFFGPDTRKFLYSHLAGALTFIPYGTMVDHFQHIVYEKPDMTPAERNAAWKELTGIYMPWVKMDGEIPFYTEGRRWQRQHHIYSSPFYYIDYCLAQTVSLEFWAMIQKDLGNAWKHYMAYTEQGGSRTFTELLKNAGLESPFEENCLRTVCAAAEEWLDSYDMTGIL